MAWTIEFLDSAAEELRKLHPHAARRILRFLHERIAPIDNPRSVGAALSGPLRGLWKYRVGDFRVIVSLNDDALIITAVRIGHRSSVYR
jgi:mRNA interferase RelE/StbE